MQRKQIPILLLLCAGMLFLWSAPLEGQMVKSEGRLANMPSDGEIRSVLGLLDFAPLEFNGEALSLDEPFTVEVMIEGTPEILSLVPKSMRSRHFRVLIADESGVLREVEPPPPCTFRGVVLGHHESKVAASMINGQLHAMIGLRGQESADYFVQPLPEEAFPSAPHSAHVVYLSDDSYVDEIHTFEYRIDPEAVSIQDRIRTQGNGRSSGSAGNGLTLGPPAGQMYNTEISFDADWNFYNKNGLSVDNTIADIENVMNGVSLIYERDVDITYEIGTFIIRTNQASDPYTMTNPESLLTKFKNQWKSYQTGVHRDLAHLFTGKNLDGTTIGIGYVSVVCLNSSGYALSQSRFTTNYNQRVALTAHEIGHNYGCNGHCDAYANCKLMCSGLGGCDGLGLPNFESWAINRITAHADSKACLEEVTAVSRIFVDSSLTGTATAVSPPDLGGHSDGVGDFQRKYNTGQNVTLTAELEKVSGVLLYRFDQWYLDGVPQGPNNVLQVTLGTDAVEANVQYTFASRVEITSAPIDGVPIIITPSDLDGKGNLKTPDSLVWFAYDNFNIEAPLTFGQYQFLYWTVGGVHQPNGMNILSVTAPLYGTKVYEAKYILVGEVQTRGGHGVPGGYIEPLQKP